MKKLLFDFRFDFARNLKNIKEIEQIQDLFNLNDTNSTDLTPEMHVGKNMVDLAKTRLGSNLAKENLKSTVLAIYVHLTCRPRLMLELLLEPKRFEAWRTEGYNFLETLFTKENILKCMLSSNETDASIHAVIVPLKMNALSLANFIGTGNNSVYTQSECRNAYEKQMIMACFGEHGITYENASRHEFNEYNRLTEDTTPNQDQNDTIIPKEINSSPPMYDPNEVLELDTTPSLLIRPIRSPDPSEIDELKSAINKLEKYGPSLTDSLSALSGNEDFASIEQLFSDLQGCTNASRAENIKLQELNKETRITELKIEIHQLNIKRLGVILEKEFKNFNQSPN